MLELINVVVAAIAAFAAFAAGALWYMTLSKPWIEASGVELDESGQPKGGQSPALFAYTFVMQLIVAGMMRHVFELGGIDTVGKGIVAGLGIGLFIVAPWTAINNAYGMRPIKLTLIDGGYATVACAIIGFLLTLF